MEPLISSIMGWGPTWAPRSWAVCGGQLLAISSNEALFSLIGTQYGGDGRTTFGLPDLRARAPVGYGQSPGTTFHPIGALLGSENQTLTQLEMPVHNHAASTQGLSVVTPAVSDNTSADTSQTPGPDKVLGQAYADQFGQEFQGKIYADATSVDTTLHPGSVSGQVLIGNAGGSQPFSIVQPITAINFVIALFGIYPSRN